MQTFGNQQLTLFLREPFLGCHRVFCPVLNHFGGEGLLQIDIQRVGYAEHVKEDVGKFIGHGLGPDRIFHHLQGLRLAEPLKNLQQLGSFPSEGHAEVFGSVELVPLPLGDKGPLGRNQSTNIQRFHGVQGYECDRGRPAGKELPFAAWSTARIEYHLPMLQTLTNELGRGRHLTDDQVRDAIVCLTDEHIPVVTKADFLTALARKGETIGEIAGFVRELRGRSIAPLLDEGIRGGTLLDVVGTGGDRLSTFNISTTVALLAAAAGVCVVKHGNRGSTSPVGSADVMEALGIPFDLGADQVGAFLVRHRFAFFFAPKYHPAFRHIVPARKLCAERGQGTIFNFLGPLLNPARPDVMLVGVSRPDLCEPLAKVLQSVGVRRAMVVCGSVPMADGTVRHLDELSSLGPTTIAEFHQDHAFCVSTLDPSSFPIQPVCLEDLKGGGREENAGLIKAVLKGEDRGPRRDVVLLNAAAALFVAGRAMSLTEGWEVAASTIDSGAAWSKFLELVALTPPR